ncbi:hypothetical protein LCL99_10105 [Halomonas denitrificans]|nr:MULTISPECIES: hypothetical protein [Halomonas]MED5294305.1 hypothetical protein [Pseudomonadota bacterium]MBN8413348.1 hypothetical protein [Halomonas litopenaei]MBY6029308.1 hypothetical protein [Halomonas sp. DP8Y7-1]MBY6208688.1 hypothetical protein [Halomonas sp. DP3Y7-2]MBY6227159.1 hypothetical protein [Halomonas sp. DP3Y7-1]
MRASGVVTDELPGQPKPNDHCDGDGEEENAVALTRITTGLGGHVKYLADESE